MKRDGLVYSLYLKNIRNLTLVTLVVLAFYFWNFATCFNYLRNYLFPTDEIDWDSVAAAGTLDPTTEGLERPAGDDAAPDMFYMQWVYQEDNNYRFKITVDAVEETGIYYDDLNAAYYNCTDLDDFNSRLPAEDWGVFRLVLVEAGGQTFVAALPFEDSIEAGETVRAVFAPMAETSTMYYDLGACGYTDSVSSWYIDLRDTPVDYEDEDFKDMCFYTLVALGLLALTVIFLLKPKWHPTYRQLAKYGKSVEYVVELVDTEYAEKGFTTDPREKKTFFLETWMVRRSMFMNVIQKNYRHEAHETPPE